MTDLSRRYRKNLANDEAGNVYDELLNGLMEFRYPIEISTELSCREFFGSIAHAIEYDNPQLYYVNFDEFVILPEPAMHWKIFPSYSMSKQKRRETDKQVNILTREVLSEAVNERDFADRYWKLYDWLMNRSESVEYRNASPEAGCITGPVLFHEATCEGYAKAFKYLCDQLNDTLPEDQRRDCIVAKAEIPNPAEGDAPGHAWNIIFDEDGEAYYCDITCDKRKNIAQNEAIGFMFTEKEVFKDAAVEEYEEYYEEVDATCVVAEPYSLDEKPATGFSITINGTVLVNGNIQINIVE